MPPMIPLTRVVILLLAVLGPAAAHEAPSGMVYDAQCCSDQDCAPIPAARVSVRADGWHVHLEPGDHPLVFRIIDTTIPFDSPRLRKSTDGRYHACIFVSRLFCFYAPPTGF